MPQIDDSLDRITHSSLTTKVYESLRATLASGELPPNHKLSGRLLAQRLGVSQTPVREAMLQLVAERALTMNRNKSVTVPTLTSEKFIDLRDIRVALESLACGCAVTHITDADIDTIEALHRDMMMSKKAGDYRTTMRLNRDVHMRIYKLSQRPELMALIESLWARTGPYLNLLYTDSDRAGYVPHEHERLIAALRARDPDLCAASISRDIISGGAAIIDALLATANNR